MHYLFIAIIVLVVTLILAGCSPKIRTFVKPNDGRPDVRHENIVSMTKEEIAERLQKLESEPKPVLPECDIAMCYGPRVNENVTTYVCPKCGSRTLYYHVDERDLPWRVSHFPSWRTKIGSIKGLSVTLDETEFCESCTPKNDDPRLGLVIRYADGGKHKVRPISWDDLELLSSFASGSNSYISDEFECQESLKGKLQRLEELLGVKTPELPPQEEEIASPPGEDTASDQ